jgi:ATP-dependent helicase/nuclease subunit A
MISFFKAIDNPYDDIAMLSVLRLPYTFSYFSEQKIAEIRYNHTDISLYENLQIIDNEKVKQFLEIFDSLKLYSFNHSPYDLLLKIDEVTDYRLFVSTLINGAQRKANLDLFFEIVKQNQNDYPYLKDMIYYLDNASDFAPGLASSNEEAVEFMTIHKSKGLEFPVVFVCNMHKKFNMSDSRAKIMIDKKMGIAIKPRKRVSTENLDDVIVEYDNCYRNIINKYQTDETINEEMRILYVALTRASYKLILTGVMKDINEIVEIQQKLLVNSDEDMIHKENAKDILLYDRLRKSKDYLSWVLAAILRHPNVIEQCLQIEELKQRALSLKQLHFERRSTFDSTEHAMFSLNITYDSIIESLIPKNTYHIKDIDNNQDNYDDYIYPYDLDKKHTIAVTELQRLNDDHYLNIESSEDNLMSATDKGTLIHLFMSYLNFKDDNVDDIISMMYEEKLIDDIGMSILLEYKTHLDTFIHSPCYEMISHSDYIYKEKSFSYFDKDLNQIVHGIFDLVFVYHNQVYVLDYKSDRVSNKNSHNRLIDKHKVQLNYYQKVLKDMYNQDIKAIVYYLHIDKAIEF